MKKQEIKDLDFEALMLIKPIRTSEKLIWEREVNKHLTKENDRLNTELLSKNTALEQELKFYKELYTEGHFAGVNLDTSNYEKIKLQKKELARLSQKMFEVKKKEEFHKQKYSGLKKAISERIESFVMELDQVHTEGSRFINPVKTFFLRLKNK